MSRLSPFNVIELSQTDSTFTRLRTLAESDPSLPSGTLLTTSYQTHGRGQAGNSWYSSPGLNLLPSLFLKDFTLPTDQIWSLSEMIALAVADTISYCYTGDKPIQIKWPNDILLGGKKISGILISTNLEAGATRVNQMIAGIGINVNEPAFPPDLPLATSLAIETKREWSLMPILSSLENNISRYYDILFAPQGATLLHSAYLDRLFLCGKPGSFRDTGTGECFPGVLQGVSPQGDLLLTTDKGEDRAYHFKEVAYLF